MGLRVVLEIYQQENISFADINALNQNLSNTLIGELAQFNNDPNDYDEPFTGFLKFEAGKLKLAGNFDGYFEGYGTSSQVWSCFNQEEAQTIADGMSAGKIVFHKDIEGNPDEYWVITPGKFEMIEPAKLKF